LRIAAGLTQQDATALLTTGMSRLNCHNRREDRKAKNVVFALPTPPAAAHPASPGDQRHDILRMT
jgi:hypothetical protein